MRSDRVHFVDGPFSGQTMMVEKAARVIRVPYLPDPPSLSRDFEPTHLVSWRELEYVDTGIETRFGTRVFVYEP